MMGSESERANSSTNVLTRQGHDIFCDITLTDLTFDSDNDGTPDLWEKLYDAMIIGVNDAFNDPDGDGLNDEKNRTRY